MDLHEIARQVASTAGADFAFVLSQAGLLVTHDAPRDMPDRGRMRILWACPAGKNGDVVHLEMPRQDLVPWGGAAPVDVFAMRVEDTAILVAVMASWNDKSNVVLALTTGAAALAEMIHKAKRLRAQKNAGKKPAEGKRPAAPAAAPEPRRERAAAAPEPRRERTTIPFEPMRRDRPSTAQAEAKRDRASAVPPEPKRDRASAVPSEPKRDRAGAVSLPHARRERAGSLPKLTTKKLPRSRQSEPEIFVSEAEVGRETMLALEAFRPRPRSEPEIILGEAPIGRETLVAIDASLPRARPGSAPDGVRIQLASISRESILEVERAEAALRSRGPTIDEPLVDRGTLPWVDNPSALKRSIEAKAAARAAAPPEVKLGIAEIDPDALEQALREGDKG